MNCPYCNRRTSDMPEHLNKNPKCKDKHSGVLKTSFLNVVNNKIKDAKNEYETETNG